MRTLPALLLLVAACGGDDSSGGPDAAPAVNWNVEGTLSGQTVVVLHLRITDVEGAAPVIEDHEDVPCDELWEISATEWQLVCSSSSGNSRQYVSIEVADEDTDGVLTGYARIDLEGIGDDSFDVTVAVEGD